MITPYLSIYHVGSDEERGTQFLFATSNFNLTSFEVTPWDESFMKVTFNLYFSKKFFFFDTGREKARNLQAVYCIQGFFKSSGKSAFLQKTTSG